LFDTMLSRICYLGDDTIQGAASYLIGVMTHFGLAFDHVPSLEPPDTDFTSRQYALYVLSDYPAARFRAGQIEHMVRCVESGSGLAMFGGWESFFGRRGEYHCSPLADVLPVAMLDRDDRRNSAQPCLIEKVRQHPMLDALPWDQPPGIGGYNAVSVKPDAETLLRAVHFSVRFRDGTFEFSRGESAPLLVVGGYGKGRTAALTTDVAPHWVGGLVDWGNRRLFQEIPAGFIEVGNWYAEFFRNLLVWTGRINHASR
jgi:uncharacterized membrane protein